MSVVWTEHMAISPATTIATAVQQGAIAGVGVAVPSGTATVQSIAVMQDADIVDASGWTATLNVLVSADGGVTWTVSASQTWQSGPQNVVRGTSIAAPPSQSLAIPAGITHVAVVGNLGESVSFGNQINFADIDGNLL